VVHLPLHPSMQLREVLRLRISDHGERGLRAGRCAQFPIQLRMVAEELPVVMASMLASTAAGSKVLVHSCGGLAGRMSRCVVQAGDEPGGPAAVAVAALPHLHVLHNSLVGEPAVGASCRKLVPQLL